MTTKTKKLPLDDDIAASETPFDPYEATSAYAGVRARRRPGNPAMASVYRQGRQAARNGVDQRENPYHRREQFTTRGSVTFSRAFVRAWGDGWHAEHGILCHLFPCHDGPCEPGTRRDD